MGALSCTNSVGERNSMIKRNGSAHWEGGLLDGNGNVSTASGVLSKTQYSFKTRFENGVGTNPEELIAAAHAGCFSMALSKDAVISSDLTAAAASPRVAFAFESTSLRQSVSRSTRRTAANSPEAASANNNLS